MAVIRILMSRFMINVFYKSMYSEILN
jgi:hypothetical protein